MIALYEKIYESLKLERGFVPVRILASRVNKSDRQLRAVGSGASVLDGASVYILEKYGKVIITRTGNPSGVALTDNPHEVDKAIQQLEQHHWREAEKVKRMKEQREKLSHVVRGEKQMQLSL